MCVLYFSQGPKADGLAGFPDPLALSSENLDPRGAFLLNDGLRFVLWLGKEFVKDLLGPEAAFAADSSKVVPLLYLYCVEVQLSLVLESAVTLRPVRQVLFRVQFGHMPWIITCCGNVVIWMSSVTINMLLVIE